MALIAARDLAWGCKSPSGSFPYLAMLHAYFDESGYEFSGRFCVIGGFIGTEVQWAAFAADWKSGLGQRQHLHMNDLRWANKKRTGDLLSRLGPVPYKHNLFPVVGVVERDSYQRTIDPIKPLAKHLSPWLLAFKKIAQGIARSIPKNESVKMTFERQTQFSPIILDIYNLIKDRYPASAARLVGIDFIDKDSSYFTEPADYFAFSIREFCTNEHSIKAMLSRPIMGDLETVRYMGGVYGEKEMQDDVREFTTNILIRHARRY